MVHTFDPSLSTPKDWIRHNVGDIDMTDDPETGTPNALREDETYDAMLNGGLTIRQATIQVARSLANEYGQQPSMFNQPSSIGVSWGDRVRAWLATVTSLTAEENAAKATGGGMHATRATRDDDCQGAEYVRPHDANWYTPPW